MGIEQDACAFDAHIILIWNEVIMGMEQEQTPHKRRVRYKGKYPKKYEEKYKELQPEKYGDTIAHVISKGNTPAGMHRSIMVQEILDFLKEEGIVHGIQRSKISCNAIAATIRENYNDITWVSVRIEGTRLVLTVKEGVFTEAVEKEKNTPCNLTADQNGVIVRMITRAGYPKLHVGEECHIGDVLVSGCLELKNDSQEVVRYEGVHADADIYIKRKKAYYREIPLQYQSEEYDGRERKSYFFKTGNTYLEFGKSAEKNWQNTVEEQILRLTDSFRLPFTVGKITRKYYETVPREYTEKEVRALAWRTLQLYEEKLIEKGVQISANNVKIEVDHKTCISKGFLEIIEKIGRETPVEIPEQPAERTTEDGEQHY